MTNTEFTQHFFLQAALVFAAVGVLGKAVRRVGQPAVIGEMLAGIVLGPSLLGLIFPELQARLFPAPTVSVLHVISQVGLVLYMFLVGLELDVDLIARRMQSAVAISLTGILVPFALGGGLTLILAHRGDLFPHGVGWDTVLFMGAAISVTAFPMLARIVQELGLSGTPMGTLTLAAAAVDDVAAWSLLAFALAGTSQAGGSAVVGVLGAAAYAVIMLLLGRRALRWLEVRATRSQDVGGLAMALVLALVMLGGFFTDRLGIHAVFGAFIMGVAMPRGLAARIIDERIRPLVQSLLLPLFFVYSGLNTRIGTVALDPDLWLPLLAVLVVACVGKGLACSLAALWKKEPIHRALGIGVLMNARGMVELILLNIGLERNMITPSMFSIMVIMTLTTTLMATPLFKLLWRRRQELLAQPARASVPSGS